MNKERWEEVSENEYIKFNRIPETDRLSSYPDVCAFLYLEKILGPSSNNSDIISDAQHDEFFLTYSFEDLEKLTDEDAIYLSRCGCRWDGEYDCLAFFT